MRLRFSPGFLLTLLLIATLGAAAWFMRWQETHALRTQLAVQKLTADELGRLKAENERLRAAQIPAAELESLRADHAALPRLRAEIEAAAAGK